MRRACQRAMALWSSPKRMATPVLWLKTIMFWRIARYSCWFTSCLAAATHQEWWCHILHGYTMVLSAGSKVLLELELVLICFRCSKDWVVDQCSCSVVVFLSCGAACWMCSHRSVKNLSLQWIQNSLRQVWGKRCLAIAWYFSSDVKHWNVPRLHKFWTKCIGQSG